MPVRIETLTEVSEQELQDSIKDFRDAHADVVTAINDGKGTFTVEATFFDGAPGTVITKLGKMSIFGGPDDTGVTPSEGLALFTAADIPANSDLFLQAQPPDTTGIARRLDPKAKYLACRWDFALTPRNFLRSIKVKVSNPANGKSEDARPVDFGPNQATGRVADLSPGLATALGLKTDETCKVEISPHQTGIAVGVNLAAIDAAIFPSDMTRTLVVMTTSNNATYWVLNQVGPHEGGQSLMRRVATNAPELLRSNTTILPIREDDEVSAAVAAELNKAVSSQAAPPATPGGARPTAADDVSAKVFAKAETFVGHDTAVPGTDHGNLACAWAVNEVVRLALGRPISGGNTNGLGTSEMHDVLEAHHTKLSGAEQAKPGTIVISPTVGTNHGHVGIVGTATGGVGDTQIFSNSSRTAKFARNYTIGKWSERYVDEKHLQVLFYQLSRDQF
jgi:hypothetical protein